MRGSHPDTGIGYGGKPVSLQPLSFLSDPYSLESGGNRPPLPDEPLVSDYPEGCSIESGFEPGVNSGLARRSRRRLGRLRKLTSRLRDGAEIDFNMDALDVAVQLSAPAVLSPQVSS